MTTLTAPTPTPTPKATLVDTGLLADVQRFGAASVSACFSCGNCTAICPLADNDGTFPRRIIRYAQVGMKDSLLSSKELWTCYHCGLCTETCPQQADPGGFMAAARRYAIASYDRTRLARTMYLRPVLSIVITAAVAAFFAVFMYSQHGSQSRSSLKLFRFIPESLIHWTGIAVMVVAGLAALAGIVMMARRIAATEGIALRGILGGRAAIGRTIAALWAAVGIEALGQRRYWSGCADAQRSASKHPEPLWRRRWLVHAATIWGFLGLLLASTLDYLLALAGVRATGTAEPVWYPVRLLGTVAGLALIYGVSVLILNRLRRVSESVAQSATSDWILLALLWITGLTGFLLEISLYLPNAPAWGYWILLVHVAIAMDLLLLAPFMKFAHAVYRPVALFFHALAASQAGSST